MTTVASPAIGCWEGRKTMGGKTLTRADLAEAVVQKVGLPRNESQELVELILREISTSLAAGHTVKLCRSARSASARRANASDAIRRRVRKFRSRRVACSYSGRATS